MEEIIYPEFTFWACVDHNNDPLGYVKAPTLAIAIEKASERWPDAFNSCYMWDGVL